jgi:hypothetical protein
VFPDRGNAKSLLAGSLELPQLRPWGDSVAMNRFTAVAGSTVGCMLLLQSAATAAGAVLQKGN